jgi:hypothetical protein
MKNVVSAIQIRLRPRLSDLIFIAAFCASVWIAFSYFFDTSILNPTNIGWISEGDLRQHYLGWVAIRQADTLGAPLGTSPLLAYPFGAPISSTDSNPLISLILWIISDYLPTDFQFIGPWYLLSLALGLAFATGLMIKSGYDRLTALVLGAVLAFQPILFWRYGHDTLTAQWLILAAIYMSYGVHSGLRAAVGHGVILALAISIHPYLFMMVAIIAGLDVFARVLRTNGLRFGSVERMVLYFGLVIAGATFLGTQLGIFALENAYRIRVGVFSTDLLGFFNPFDASRFMPQLPAGDGQYEGFAYLGLGGIVLLVVVLVLAIRGTNVRPNFAHQWPLFGAALIAFAFALSPIVTLLGEQVFALSLSDDSPISALFSKLRSSGRFVWVTIYVLIFSLLTCLPRNKAFAVRSFALVILALQMWDLGPLRDRIKEDTAFQIAPASVFDAPEWRARIADADHIYMSRALGLEFSLDIGATAFPLETPLSWFYTAQGLGLPRQTAAEEQLRLQVLAGTVDQTALYLLDATTELPLTHQNASGIWSTHRVGSFHVVDTLAYSPEPELDLASNGLTELLEWCATDCTALMVAHGAASTHLSAQIQQHIAQKGGQIGDMVEGAGYALVLRSGQIIDEAMVLAGDATSNVVVEDRAISLLSSVANTGTKSMISVDGIDFARSTPGMNLLLVHDDGRLVSAVFDTTALSDSLHSNAAFESLADSAIDAEASLDNLLVAQIDRIAGPESVEGFVNLERVLTRESSLLDVLSRCRQDCAMAISVKDEGASSMPNTVREMSRQMGLTLSDLAFRDGYSAIIENGIVLVQGRSFQETVDVAEVVGGQQIMVRSAGYEAGNFSSIQIDGEELSLNHRGINIVVLIDGERAISYHFDTHGGM